MPSFNSKVNIGIFLHIYSYNEYFNTKTLFFDYNAYIQKKKNIGSSEPRKDVLPIKILI